MSNIISVEVIKDAAKNKTSASLSRPAVAELAGALARMEARIAELEAAMRVIEQNAGVCVELGQANWTLAEIKHEAADALKGA